MDGFSDAVSITAVSTNTGLQPAKLQPCFLKRIFNYRRMITMKTNKTWKVLTALLLCALIVVGCLYALGVGWKSQPASSVSGEEMLSLWTEDAASKKALIEYIDAVTDEGGAEFIPVEKRVSSASLIKDRETGTALRLLPPREKTDAPEEMPLWPPAADLTGFILTGSSTIVFQALQEGHCPIHLAAS